MKSTTLKLTALALMLAGIRGHAATYELTITNGGPMPLSPSVTYVLNGQEPLSAPGEAPAAGFVRLCQMGDAPSRATELASVAGVNDIQQTMGLIQPGESRTIEVQVMDPQTQSIQFETMYGKTKDTCGIASFGSHSLQALLQHVTPKVLGKDEVVQTGAFASPALPMGHTYLNSTACASQMTAIDCLRTLSAPNMTVAKIHAAEPYLSSIAMFLERKFGSSETQSLLLSGSGAIRFQLKLKH